MTDSAMEAAIYIGKIIKERCVFVASATDHDASIMTAIVDILEDEDAVVFGYSGSEELDKRIRQSQSLSFSTYIDDTNVHFTSGPVEDVEHESGPAFCIQIPRSINRVQRRDAYRATIPPSERPDCFVEYNGKRYEATIINISIGGVGAIIANTTLRPRDVIGKCRIDTPIGICIEAALEIVYVGPKIDNGKEARYGCKFKGVSRAVEAQLQRYVTYLQGLEYERRRALND